MIIIIGLIDRIAPTFAHTLHQCLRTAVRGCSFVLLVYLGVYVLDALQGPLLFQISCFGKEWGWAIFF